MTAGGQSFKLYVKRLLNKIHPPVCRQLNVDTIEAIFKASNSEYRDHVISIDDIINQAINFTLQPNSLYL
jgi:Phosphorylase b kinase C-terminal domain